jgi:hypothetical protein
MRALLLPDLALALAHVLDEKAEVLACMLCGQMYRPRLVAQLEAIEALPPIGPTGRPLAEALDEAELLADTIALLSDLRCAIADELVGDPAALDQIEHDVFGFIDMLAADREASVRRRAMATTMVVPASVVSEAAPSAE